MRFKSKQVALLIMVLGIAAGSSVGQRQIEKIDRGMVAIAQSDGTVYLGWRLLNTDPQTVGFNLYRQTAGSEAVKLNEYPITRTTDYVDTKAPKDRANNWWVCPVMDGKEQAIGGKTSLPANPPAMQYIGIPFQGKYVCNKVAIADLNGDGQYDYVIKQPKQITDPGVWFPSTDTWKVEAYLHDGTFLWRKDLGWNIEQGIWYSPMIVYDFDGDGKAEIALKTAPTDVDYRNQEDELLKGKVAAGPEYCSILDGMTGKEIDRVDWIARGKIEDWGDAKTNRASRHLMGIAFLDGKRPSLLVLRGTYMLMRADAYNLDNKKLKAVWNWSGDDENPPVRGQGMHGMHAADIDGDGKDEIILGSAVLDDNGKILWNVGLGHPDACYVTDILPDRPGLEIMYGIEPEQEKNGICLADARTGKLIWGRQEPTNHVHSQGLLGDFDPNNPGVEFYSYEKFTPQSYYTYSMNGKLLSDKPVGVGKPNVLYWTAGVVKLCSSGGQIRHYNGSAVTPYEGTVLAIADCLGDWREELITVVEGELRIYTTTIPAKDRHVTLMQDPIYRNDVALVSMGYFYPPQLSYYLTQDSAKTIP
ncbi:MAG: silent information regulator protein Sir2 [Planctomycetes bacterium]|nr:silent information regulator protein Sir2 [Planctomycetota bacterium]